MRVVGDCLYCPSPSFLQVEAILYRFYGPLQMMFAYLTEALTLRYSYRLIRPESIIAHVNSAPRACRAALTRV